MTPLGYHDKWNYPADTTFVIGAGAAGEVGYCKENFWAADDCYPIECDERVRNRYLYHFLLSKKSFLLSRVRKASIPRLSRTVIEKMIVPVPSLAEQDRIISILDRFDALCKDISVGLPAEIEARQKQYEYYRDKLLTFNFAA